MVDSGLKYLLLVCLSAVAVNLSAADCDGDTVFVFKKVATEAVVPVKKEAVKSAPVKKKRKTKKKSAVKKSVAKKVVKQKSDSVTFTPVRYSLGDRVLMRGDSGADVRKLAEIMVKNLYLDEKAVPYTKSGEVLYDGELVRAVKLFQKVSGLYDDGVVGTTTIKELRKIHRWRRTSK